MLLIANTGLDPDHPRVCRLAPLLGRATRPDPRPDDSPVVAWATWLDLLSLHGIEPGDPQAIIRRRTLPGGLVHGSSSVSLVAMSESSIRYDFVAIGEPPLPLTDSARVPV